MYFFFLFHAIVDLRHRSGMKTIFYFLNILNDTVDRRKLGIKEKFSCAMSQSYRPLAWFLRPIKYRHKLPFRCVPILAVIGPRFPLTVEFFSFVVARKMSLLLYQTFLQELTLAFVSVNLYLCLQCTLGVGKILYFLSR